jgi:hypothetical protein
LYYHFTPDGKTEYINGDIGRSKGASIFANYNKMLFNGIWMLDATLRYRFSEVTGKTEQKLDYISNDCMFDVFSIISLSRRYGATLRAFYSLSTPSSEVRGKNNTIHYMALSFAQRLKCGITYSVSVTSIVGNSTRKYSTDGYSYNYKFYQYPGFTCTISYKFGHQRVKGAKEKEVNKLDSRF